MDPLTLPADPVRAKVVDMAAAGRLPLPAVPRVVTRLIRQLRDDATSIPDLVAEVEQEPHIAARVLRMANSPYYGGRRSVSSIDEAVALIGTQALKTLVISGGLAAAFVSVPGVNLRDFWREAQLTAAAGRSLAVPLGADREAAYLTGLLSQVGQLILCQAFAHELAPRLARSMAPRGAMRAQVEKDACGLTYPEVGAAWMDTLGFPVELSQAVAHQLVPEATDGPLGATLGMALRLGDAVRDGLDTEAAWASLAGFVDALPDGVVRPTHLEALHQGFEALHARLASAGEAP